MKTFTNCAISKGTFGDLLENTKWQSKVKLPSYATEFFSIARKTADIAMRSVRKQFFTRQAGFTSLLRGKGNTG